MFIYLGRILLRKTAQNVRRHSTVKIPDMDTLKMAVVDPKILKPYINPKIAQDDYFKIKDLVSIEDMFNARVHFDNMKWALFGERLDVCIFDLNITQRYFTKALTFLAHMSYQEAIILFITTQRSQMLYVEKLSKDLNQYSHTRKWQEGTFTNSRSFFGAPVRLPDVVVFFNTLTSVLEPHPAIIECAKLAIPTVAIVDSNSEPNYITYPVPGNDDSMASFNYYLQKIKQAIHLGAQARKDEQKLEKNNSVLIERKKMIANK